MTCQINVEVTWTWKNMWQVLHDLILLDYSCWEMLVACVFHYNSQLKPEQRSDCWENSNHYLPCKMCLVTTCFSVGTSIRRLWSRDVQKCYLKKGNTFRGKTWENTISRQSEVSAKKKKCFGRDFLGATRMKFDGTKTRQLRVPVRLVANRKMLGPNGNSCESSLLRYG